jgi:type IV pilus assembly protein PilM
MGILSSLSDIFKSSPNSAVGVDIGSSSIKVVQLKKKGDKIVLDTYGAISLGPYAEKDIGDVTNLEIPQLKQALSDVLRESSITTKTAAVSISSSSSLIFVLDLPGGIPQKGMDAVVRTEARKYIPVSISEVSLDWWILPHVAVQNDFIEGEEAERKSRIRVLVAAIHQGTIEKYRTIISQSGLSCDAYEIEVFSALRGSLRRESGTIALVDVGAMKTKITTVSRGVVNDVHIVNKGSVDITRILMASLDTSFTNAEKMKHEIGLEAVLGKENIAQSLRPTISFITGEIKQHILQYEQKSNDVVDKVVLLGGGSLLRGFTEVLQKEISVDVMLSDPFEYVDTPAFLEDVLEQTGPEFSVATGLALLKLQK